ncbi:MAG: flagellar FliJ family protein [Myxococcales bacterium]|nr:flagellar FliJ family protein [Myxococcales bacterium]
MTPRLARVNRLLGVRARAFDVSRAARLRAAQALQEAEEERETITSTRAAVAQEDIVVESIEDLSSHRMRLMALQRAAEAAARVVTRLSKVHEEAREAVVESRREVRKLELFRDAVEQGFREDEGRAERRAEDEASARVVSKKGAG